MICTLVTAVLLSTAYSASVETDTDDIAWQSFKAQYNRRYTGVDDDKRQSNSSYRFFSLRSIIDYKHLLITTQACYFFCELA
jgi:hypothetical protein